MKILGEPATTLEPMGNMVVVKHIQTMKIKGIEMPKNMRETLPRGKVMAVGPGDKTLSGTIVPINLKPGDIVRFRSWVITDMDADVLLVDANEILAKEISE